MINLGLIGQHGKLGLYLQQHLTFDYIFGRNNFIDIPGTNINILICAAPSANIEEINSGIKTATGQLAHELDMEATLFFMDHLRQSTIQKSYISVTLRNCSAPTETSTRLPNKRPNADEDIGVNASSPTTLSLRHGATCAIFGDEPMCRAWCRRG